MLDSGRGNPAVGGGARAGTGSVDVVESTEHCVREETFFFSFPGLLHSFFSYYFVMVMAIKSVGIVS